MPEQQSLSDQLREAVSAALDDGYSRYEIAKRAGIKPYLITLWLDRGKDLRLATAQKIAALFDMRFTKPKKLRD